MFVLRIVSFDGYCVFFRGVSVCFSGRRRVGGRVLGALANATGSQRALTGANRRQRAGQRGHAPASAGSRPSALPTEREIHTHTFLTKRKKHPGGPF